MAEVTNNCTCTVSIKVNPRKEQSQPPAVARSTPAAAKSTRGSEKINHWQRKSQPRQQQKQPPALISAVCSVQRCTAQCTDSAVKCKVKPKNAATLPQLLNYPFKGNNKIRLVS